MTDGNSDDDPATGSQPLFSRVYTKPMSVEQLYDSLLVATWADRITADDWESVAGNRRRWQSQFVHSFETDENDEAVTFAGTITQAMMMMNGPRLNVLLMMLALMMALMMALAAQRGDDAADDAEKGEDAAAEAEHDAAHGEAAAAADAVLLLLKQSMVPLLLLRTENMGPLLVLLAQNMGALLLLLLAQNKVPQQQLLLLLTQTVVPMLLLPT